MKKNKQNTTDKKKSNRLNHWFHKKNCKEVIFPNWWQSLYHDEKGAATLEIVIIIAVLIAIALIFNTQLRNFATALFNKVFDDSSVLDQIGTIGS